MNVVNITGSARTEFGKQANKRLRVDGLVPCVIYGGDAVVHITVNEADLKPVVYSDKFNVIEIEKEGKVIKAVLKDVQFHPVSEIVEHVDFQELVSGKKVKVEVPVRFFGDSPGVKEGGSVVTVLRKMQVKATPEKLVSELIGDISGLDLNQSIYVRDMEIPEGVEVMQESGSPVGYISTPRSLKSLESSLDIEGEEGEEGEEGAEGAEGAEGTEGAETPAE